MNFSQNWINIRGHSKIMKFFIGLFHLCLVHLPETADCGVLKGMGDNRQGQLGVAIYRPAAMVREGGIIGFSAGSLRSAYITVEHDLFGIGSGYSGSLGTGNNDTRTLPVFTPMSFYFLKSHLHF